MHNEPIAAASRSNGHSSRLARYYAAQGRDAHGCTLSPAPAPAAPEKTLRPAATAPLATSPAEVVQNARSQAKARFCVVMGSDAVKGREQQARDLLIASCDRGARFPNSSAIIAELRIRPLDAEAQRLAAEQARKAKVEAILTDQRAWRGSVAQANRIAGFDDGHTGRSSTAVEQSWKRAAEQANHAMGFGE